MADIDLAAGTLRVRRNVQRIRRELIFGTPRTMRSFRTVPLPKRCVRALTEHREQQERERKVTGRRAWADASNDDSEDEPEGENAA